MISASAYITRLREQARRAREAKSFWPTGARILCVAILIIGLLDVLSTNAALTAGGVEANPLFRAIQAQMGNHWAVPKILGHALLAVMVLWFPSRQTVLVMTAAMTLNILAVANNLAIALQI